MKIYIAGSLFNEAERKQRKWEGERLREVFPDAEIYNPIDQSFNTLKDELITPQMIYEGDVRGIQTSDVFIADLTNEDPGVSLALGIAIQSKVSLIIGVNSDSRITNANQYEIPSYGMNHFVLGAIVTNGVFVSSFEEAVNIIKAQYQKKS